MTSPTAPTSAPTRVRYSVLFLLCLLAMITYMDRAANGSARAVIMQELNADLPQGQQYNTEDFFWVLMAFQFAYAIFEIPSGWLGDTKGPRSTLLRVVLWWSVFVALTGFVATNYLGVYLGFSALIVIQFLFGVGEAGAFPNIAKALYNWFPAADRGFAKSAVWMAARLMGGLTPLVWILIVEIGGLSWRQAMWLFAGIAVLWTVLFYFFFKNKPSEHASVNAAELAEIDAGRVAGSHIASKVPFKKLFLNPNLWAVCGMYIVTNFCWYFLMYNHPALMKQQYPEADKSYQGKILLALLSGAPLLIGMLGCLLGGILSDRYIRRTGDRKWGRRWIGMIGYGGASLCYFAAAGVKQYNPSDLYLFAGLLILMGFMNDLIMAPAWAVCQDIGQKYAATVSGTMNMVGNLLGAVPGILVTGQIMSHYKDDKNTGMTICFIIFGTVYFLGVVLWLMIDASKPLVTEEESATPR